MDAVPPTREFTAAWISYALFAIGVFLWWPALLGAIVCIAKRDAPGAGFIDTHYTWLARTFGWSALGSIVCIGVIVASAWPLVHDIIIAVQQSGGDWNNASMSIKFNWPSIFLTAGIASAGVFGLLAVWFWFIYRVVRGAFRLGAAQPVP
jgi:uncharacterized membrane protein